jgi:hypothetical protein
MQGWSDPQRELLDVESVAAHLLAVGSVFAILAAHRHQLLVDSMFEGGSPAPCPTVSRSCEASRRRPGTTTACRASRRSPGMNKPPAALVDGLVRDALAVLAAIEQRVQAGCLTLDVAAEAAVGLLVSRVVSSFTFVRACAMISHGAVYWSGAAA